MIALVFLSLSAELKKIIIVLVLFLKDSVKFWNSFVQSCNSQSYSLRELKETLYKPIICIVTISKQITKMTWNIFKFFTVHPGSQKRHMNVPSCKDQVPLGSSSWAGGIGSNDLQKLPPASILLRFCDCYGITSLFVQ